MMFNFIKISSITCGVLSNLTYLMLYISENSRELRQGFLPRILPDFVFGLGSLSIILAIVFAIALAYKTDISDEKKYNYRVMIFILNILNILFIGFMILMAIAFSFEEDNLWDT